MVGIRLTGTTESAEKPALTHAEIDALLAAVPDHFVGLEARTRQRRPETNEGLVAVTRPSSVEVMGRYSNPSDLGAGLEALTKQLLELGKRNSLDDEVQRASRQQQRRLSPSERTALLRDHSAGMRTEPREVVGIEVWSSMCSALE